MRRWRMMGLVGVVALCVPATGWAQQQQQDEQGVGIVMGVPASVAALFHTSDAVAVRPELSFSHTTSTDSVVNGSTWLVGVGVSGIFYMQRVDNVRTYVSPRLTYSRTHLNISSSTANLVNSNGSNSSWGASGSYGAEFSPSDRFSVFGELGLAYSRQNATTSNTSGVPTGGSNGWGVRSAVGVIFYP